MSAKYIQIFINKLSFDELINFFRFIIDFKINVYLLVIKSLSHLRHLLIFNITITYEQFLNNFFFVNFHSIKANFEDKRNKALNIL
jgi:hypothetical protein